MRRRRERMDLAERLRPYVKQHRVLSEPLVDADPIRIFLLRWMIETGDPIEVVAKGFDLDVEVLSGILSGERCSIPQGQARALADRLGLSSLHCQ